MNTNDSTTRNRRDDQAEKLKPSSDHEDIARFPETGDAGDRPKGAYGLTEPAGDTSQKTRSSEGVNPPGAEPAEEEFFDKRVQDARTL